MVAKKKSKPVKKSLPAKKKQAFPKGKPSAIANAEKIITKIAVPEKEVESLSAIGKKILKNAEEMKSVKSMKDRDSAVAMIKASKEYVKRVGVFFKEPIDKAKQTVELAKQTLDSVKAREKALTKHVEQAIDLLSESVKNFDKKEIEKQNRIAEAKAKADSEKLAEDQQKANETVQEAIQTGDVDKIEEAQRQAEAVVSTTASPMVPITSIKQKNSVGSGSSRLVYKAEVVDIYEFVKAVVEGKLPRSLISCLEVQRISVIQDYATANNLPEGNTVEGFKITKEVDLRIR